MSYGRMPVSLSTCELRRKGMMRECEEGLSNDDKRRRAAASNARVTLSSTDNPRRLAHSRQWALPGFALVCRWLILVPGSWLPLETFILRPGIDHLFHCSQSCSQGCTPSVQCRSQQCDARAHHQALAGHRIAPNERPLFSFPISPTKWHRPPMYKLSIRLANMSTFLVPRLSGL